MRPRDHARDSTSSTLVPAQVHPGRQKVLVFVNLYLPGFRGGGPARSIANTVERLGDEFDFYIVTTDRDWGDLRPYPGVTTNDWNRVGKAHVYYACEQYLGLRHIGELIRNTPHDVLYLNSFFHPRFTLLPILLRALRQVPRKTLVVAPRGEFSRGALAIHRWRKWLFIGLARMTHAYAGARWQASTDDEAAAIQAALGVATTRISVARNMVASTLATHPEPPATTGEPKVSKDRVLHVCFVSRISRKKNLDFALRVMAATGIPVVFDIYGPIGDHAYWQACQALMRSVPANVTATHRGSLEPSEVRETMAKYDLLFVPTHGENFGHVFVEAWSAGTPVLTSDQTPWRRLQEKQIGWDLPLSDRQSFVHALESAWHMDDVTTKATRTACLEFAASIAEDSSVVEANRRLFLNVRHRR